MASRALPSVQTCQEHVVSYFFAMHPEYSVFNQALQLPITSWFEMWRAMVSSLDVERMQTQRIHVVQWEPDDEIDYWARDGRGGLRCLSANR